MWFLMAKAMVCSRHERCNVRFTGQSTYSVIGLGVQQSNHQWFALQDHRVKKFLAWPLLHTECHAALVVTSIHHHVCSNLFRPYHHSALLCVSDCRCVGRRVAGVSLQALYVSNERQNIPDSGVGGANIDVGPRLDQPTWLSGMLELRRDYHTRTE